MKTCAHAGPARYLSEYCQIRGVTVHYWDAIDQVWREDSAAMLCSTSSWYAARLALALLCGGLFSGRRFPPRWCV